MNSYWITLWPTLEPQAYSYSVWGSLLYLQLDSIPSLKEWDGCWTSRTSLLRFPVGWVSDIHRLQPSPLHSYFKLPNQCYVKKKLTKDQYAQLFCWTVPEVRFLFCEQKISWRWTWLQAVAGIYEPETGAAVSLTWKLPAHHLHSRAQRNLIHLCKKLLTQIWHFWFIFIPAELYRNKRNPLSD